MFIPHGRSAANIIKIALFMGVLSLVACRSEPPDPPDPPDPPPKAAPVKLPIHEARAVLYAALKVPEPTLSDLLGLIDEGSVRPPVEQLASDDFEGRRTGSPGIAKARTYLIGLLEESGLTAPNDGWAWTWHEEGYQNVMALYPGADPKLRDEVIVVGAHYDHLGISKRRRRKDRIYNGADDNASGSASIMAVALALGRSKLETRRSVLFVWFSGEEQGLYGSEAYCASPLFPLEKTAAMVNLDMVGRNPNRPAGLFGVATSPSFPGLVEELLGIVPDARVQAVAGQGALEDRSDQQAFFEAGVPVLVLHTGVHPDYHKVTDHADRIAWPRLAALSRFTAALVVGLANHPGPIERPKTKP